MGRNFKELLELAKKKGPKILAVAVAQDHEVLMAVKMAVDSNIIIPILVGDSEKIKAICDSISLDYSNIEIINELDGVKACRIATELVSSGKADILMKGLIDTSVILKAVLDHDIGLRTDRIISHVAVFEVPTYHKILMVTDAAMNISPDLLQKKEIIENAVDLIHCFDVDNPKVAVLAAKEKVSPKMEATVHAAELKKMNEEGLIKNCIVDGPLALDNAVSKESAEIKGIVSEVAGDADILLAPDINSGNILYKALTFLANAKSAGLIIGTKAPIVLTSRADNDESKLNSIALAVLKASK